MDDEHDARDSTDAALVEAARRGDRAAFAALYDRYADRIHDYCAALLRDRHEAADATQDVFLTAAERLEQLRDPQRVRPWLYAIARNRCHRKRRTRAREQPTEEVGDVADVSEAGRHAEVAELRALVWAAASGLSERDQSLLTLQLRHGLESAEVAEVLGVSASHASVLLGRMRGQVERSLGALLVAQLGRRECEELDALLRSWEGDALTPLLRKRIARHADRCEVCGERRRTAVSPVALLSAVPLVPAPMLLRDMILTSARLPAPDDGPGAGDPGGGGSPRGGRSTGRGGHPRPGGRRRAATTAALIAVLALLATLTGPQPATEGHLVADPRFPTVGFAAGAPEPSAVPEASPSPQPSPPATPAGEPEESDATPPPAAATSAAEPDGTAAAGVQGVDGGSDTVAEPVPAPTTDPAPSPTPAAPASPTSTPAPTPTPAPAPATLVVDNATIDLGADRTAGTARVRNTGEESLTVTANSAAAWVAVSPTQLTIPGGGERDLTVTVDRTGLGEGDHTASIALRSNGGDATIGVRAAVERPPVVSDIRIGHDRLGIRGCGTDTTPVSATVTDESGVGSVTLHWIAPDGQAGSTAMAQNRDRWTARLGPFEAPGTARWWITALDTRGNRTQTAERSTPVDPCPQ